MSSSYFEVAMKAALEPLIAKNDQEYLESTVAFLVKKLGYDAVSVELARYKPRGKADEKSRLKALRRIEVETVLDDIDEHVARIAQKYDVTRGLVLADVRYLKSLDKYPTARRGWERIKAKYSDSAHEERQTMSEAPLWSQEGGVFGAKTANRLARVYWTYEDKRPETIGDITRMFVEHELEAWLAFIATREVGLLTVSEVLSFYEQCSDLPQALLREFEGVAKAKFGKAWKDRQI